MKVLVAAALGIWFMVAGYFAYLGVTTTPTEGDSLAYHLPIARIVAEGKWAERAAFQKSIYYYPAWGETFLAVMARMGMPLDLFNWIGWILWTGVSYILARRGGLAKGAAIVLAVTVAMWPTVVRLISNQTVDIWLAVWWGAAVIKLTKLKQKLSDLVWMGVYLGMLVGTKYSGLLFAAALVIVFWRKIRELGWRRNMGWVVPMVVVGGWWYFRNWAITGNPVYPATMVFWQGDPSFRLMDWQPWMTLLKYPGLLSQALISEYLIWPALLLLPLVVRNKWVVLGWLNLGIYLCLPSWPKNVVSDLRYTFVGFLPLFIAGWQWMKQQGREEIMVTAAMLCVAAELTQLDYKPKLFVVLILLSGLVVAGLRNYDLQFKKKSH